MLFPQQLEAEVARLQGSVKIGQEGYEQHHEHLEMLSSKISKLTNELHELQVGMTSFLPQKVCNAFCHLFYYF